MFYEQKEFDETYTSMTRRKTINNSGKERKEEGWGQGECLLETLLFRLNLIYERFSYIRHGPDRRNLIETA